MILKEFDQITLNQYKQCTLGNTIVLYKGIKWNKRKIKERTDDAFLEISDKLSDSIKSSSGDTVLKMWRKMSANEVRLRIYVISYQILCITKDKRNIELLANNGFVYNNEMTHHDNLYKLSGEIDRLNSIVFTMEKDFLRITDDIGQIDTTIEDTIMTINNAINSNLTLDSTLADLVAANKLLKKIEEANKK